MAICGPGCSLLWTVVGIWGTIQLGLMGVFFMMKCVAFAEDINLPHTIGEFEDFYHQMNQSYLENAYNCWIASGLSLVTFLFGAQQFYSNLRSPN